MTLFDRKPKKTEVTLTPPMLAALALGGVALWALANKQRRNLARDKAISLFKRTSRRAERRGAFVASTVKGKVAATTRGVDTVPPSDPALAAKVSSEALADFPGINLNVENGVVVLRGQLDSPQRIEELEQAVRKVTGVVDVRNLVHLPGETAPNLR